MSTISAQWLTVSVEIGDTFEVVVIPAKAGIQLSTLGNCMSYELNSRFRGNYSYFDPSRWANDATTLAFLLVDRCVEESKEEFRGSGKPPLLVKHRMIPTINPAGKLRAKKTLAWGSETRIMKATPITNNNPALSAPTGILCMLIPGWGIFAPRWNMSPHDGPL